VTIAGASVW